MSKTDYKMWRFFCEICGWNKITQKIEDCGLVPMKKSSIQGKLPIYDENNKKIETPKFIEPLERFKCPGCGRVITPKQIVDAPALEKEKERLKKLLERN